MKTSKRQHTFVIRLTDTEKETLKRKTKQAGYSHVSNYVKSVLKLTDDIEPSQKPSKITLMTGDKASTQIRVTLAMREQMTLAAMRNLYGNLSNSDLIRIALGREYLELVALQKRSKDDKQA